ncbi:MAG: tRNA (adenosine(37)-N6)-threonylcarbamoyltransferase complex transferase subunit TsaD, partial [Kiritimatiellae bacterium]|nr:tRNA (adenosine(37)-N6)-threonylcarbamoyltransferase complex transferase subunit TsaD [Kiritimatiellia bacterium]
DWGGIDAIGVTYGPGLAPSLLVGLSAAKGLALRLKKPLYLINHIEAHIHSVFLDMDRGRIAEACPLMVLVVSGGHTLLVRMEKPGSYNVLGQTVDDAAGEAFDKGANLLGLGYPGGPAIDRASRGGDPRFVNFPRGRQREGRCRLPGLCEELCFSFSGLKTALLYHLKKHPLSPDRHEVPSLAASYQEAIVDALVERCDRALTDEKFLAAAGGVALNSRLRARLVELAAMRNVTLVLAQPRYCADNAAMVAGLAGIGRGINDDSALDADVEPSLMLA